MSKDSQNQEHLLPDEYIEEASSTRVSAINDDMLMPVPNNKPDKNK